MTGIVAQIVSAYERAQLDVESISEEFSLEKEAIKSCLLQHSSKYRQDVKSADCEHSLAEDYTKQELAIVTKGLLDLVSETDDPNLKFRIYKYVRDDAKGRKDVKVKALSKLGQLNMNILTFNEHIKRAKMLSGSSLNNATPQLEQPIEV